MPPRRKNSPAFIPTKTSVRRHHRTVYKRKTKPKFDLSNFVKKGKKKPQRGGSIAYGMGPPKFGHFRGLQPKDLADAYQRIVKGKKKTQRGGSVGAAKQIGSLLWEVGKPVAENFWNTAKRRAAEHKERIKRLYYYS